MNDKFVFVSVVGTQFMGTFQPLMAFKEAYGPVKSYLLLTSRIMEHEEELRRFMEANDLGEPEFVPVSMSAAGENSVPEVLRRLADKAKASGVRTCFNADGGLNYLIAACVPVLEPYQPLYIHATNEHIVLCDTSGEVYRHKKYPEPLPVEKILQLQGVEYTIVKNNSQKCEKYPLNKFFKDTNLQMPANSLQNVKIGDFIFDYIWNPGNNRLHMLKDWRFYVSGDVDRAQLDRQFGKFSTDRTQSGHIHDKQIIALTWEGLSKQRLENSSGGKITVIDMGRDSDGRDMLPDREAAARLEKELSYKPIKVKKEELGIPAHADLPPLKDGALVVALGTNIISTVLAVCSHKPKHLLLCMDPRSADAKMLSARDKIIALAPELGIESVEVADLSIDGLYPMSVLPLAGEGAKIDVNVSPGTKGQTVALARWANRHGYAIWSINNGKQVCSNLGGGAEALPLKLCEPALVLELAGCEIRNRGYSEKDLAKDADMLNAMLEFMRQAAAAGKDLNEAFTSGGIKFGSNYLQKSKGKKWELMVDGRKHTFIKEEKGVWFEKLCAMALINAGASAVRTNFQLSWNEENERFILSKYADPALYESEVDVLAIFNGDLILLSAKSYDLENIPRENKSGECAANPRKLKTLPEAVADVHNTAAHFGIFTLSLLSHMGASKNPGEEKVAVVGWRELCQPEKLASQIAALRSKKSTITE